MAVLRSHRQIASTEFENTFTKLYRFSALQTASVPKRKKKWLCTDVDRIMNQAYLDVMSVNDFYTRDKKALQEKKEVFARSGIERILSLEKHLMMMWNIQSTETKKMASWVTQINDALKLLHNISGAKGAVPTVSILDWRAINKATFLKNMSDLHKYTYTKVINANQMYDSTIGSTLITLVDSAFYNVIYANKTVPTTKRQYDHRKTRISEAIMSLEEMNRALLFYFNLMRYSERIMNEWSNLLVSEIRLLRALQKSDRERFSNLQ